MQWKILRPLHIFQTLLFFLFYVFVSIQTLYSVFCKSPFGSSYSLESSWISFTCLDLSSFSNSSLADPPKLDQMGWGASVNSYLQVSPEISYGIHCWAIAGPLKVIQILIPKPLKCYLCCMLCVRVMLSIEPSPESEAPWSMFSSKTSLHS